MARLSLLQVFLIWVAGFGTLSLALRRRVADLVDGTRLPRIIKYLAIATPIILMEEALTIEIPYFRAFSRCWSYSKSCSCRSISSNG